MVNDHMKGFGRKRRWFSRCVVLAFASRCCARLGKPEGSLCPGWDSQETYDSTGLGHDSCMYQVSAVHAGTSTRARKPRNLGSIPCRCLRFICYPECPASISCLLSLPFVEDRESVPGRKVAGAWCLAFTLFCAEIKNVWSYTSSLP
jgi:hypothetical protein